jgi:hypothetical protein
MKNIHILPTEEPSRLWFNLKGKLVLDTINCLYEDIQCQNIYITSDEEIEKGDWYKTGKFIWRMMYSQWGEEGQGDAKKIILTTDPKLIEEGVQPIPDEFLEWFVKNLSVEVVNVEKEQHNTFVGMKTFPMKPFYKIIIPSEDMDMLEVPMPIYEQETLEEASQRYSDDWENITGLDYNNELPEDINKLDFTNGAKWQAERSYSEEDMIKFFHYGHQIGMNTVLQIHSPHLMEKPDLDKLKKEWFEQFKKK